MCFNDNFAFRLLLDSYFFLCLFFFLIGKFYIKNSSVECESGSQVLPGRSSIDISITRKPRYVGSVICKPFGL